METKFCFRCGQSKPVGEFYGSKVKKTYCKPCTSDYNRDWTANNAESRQRIKRKSDQKRQAANPLYIRGLVLKKYGLTFELFDRLLAVQGARCAICAASDPGGRHGTWHIDHDHACCARSGSCGRCVRGLLCNNCNIMLGHAQEDPVRLLAAVEYLSTHKANVT